MDLTVNVFGQIRDLTQQFIDTVPELPETYKRNIQQYIEPRHTEHIYQCYKQFVTCAHQQQFDKIIDIGSGINFAKMLDTNITTSNPVGRGVGLNEHFHYINKHLNTPTDIRLFDIQTHDNWIETDQQYNLIFVHRFWPWPGLPYPDIIYKRFIKETNRILAADGQLWFYTNDRQTFLHKTGPLPFHPIMRETFVIEKTLLQTIADTL